MNENNNFEKTVSIGENTYTYVWGDEFDGNTLDAQKWVWAKEQTGMASENENEHKILDDSRAIKVENGKLKLISGIYAKNDDGSYVYFSPASVHTENKMAYLYGYCEIKAKVPFGMGLWPSFWACTEKKLCTNKKYVTEIDIFEVFGRDDGIVPNLHKWYQKNVFSYDETYNEKCSNHTQFNNYKFCEKDNKTYFFSKDGNGYDGLSNEEHIYGFEWKPDAISMYVDGQKYMTYNINKSYDSCPDMLGFHEPINIIFNNHLFVPSSGYIEEYKSGVPSVISKNVEVLPSVYEIEYFRLYQNKELKESKLYAGEY